MKLNSGFSLIELMIALAVLAIAVALAGPSMQGVLERNKASSALKEFGTAAKFARSEAIKQSASVTICASSNQSSCTGSWHQGWIIFKDIDGAGDFDTGTDTLLRSHSGLDGGQTLSFDGTNSSFVTYSSRGYAADQSGTFKLCPQNKKLNFARGLILQATGSMRFTMDSDNDGVHEDAAGTDFTCS